MLSRNVWLPLALLPCVAVKQNWIQTKLAGPVAAIRPLVDCHTGGLFMVFVPRTGAGLKVIVFGKVAGGVVWLVLVPQVTARLSNCPPFPMLAMSKLN